MSEAQVMEAQPVNLADISGLTLGDIMSRDVLTVYEGWSIKRLAGFFVKHNISGAPVVASDESLVGTVTQSDVIRFESRAPTDVEIKKVVQFYYGPNTQGLTDADIRHLKEKAIETCTVNAIMTPEVKSLDLATPVADACGFMVANDIHRLFVTQQRRLVGVVTAMDVLRHIVN